MYNAVDFIKWALSHAKRETVPEDAELPVAIEEVGKEPWEYLFGTTGHKITAARLEERYVNHYKSKGWTREAYEDLTSDWIGRTATDCQGLLDAYITEQGVKTDVNADYCYASWCTDKGSVNTVSREYEIGEAVFFCNSAGRMSHVGFVCGFLGGEPLVVEARGILHGVVVTKLSERPWSHRGLVTKQLNYVEDKPSELFTLTTPMQTGEAVRSLQKFLNDVGYHDDNGDNITVDGKLGAKTWAALRHFLMAHSPTIDPHAPNSLTVTVTAGDRTYTGVIEHG